MDNPFDQVLSTCLRNTPWDNLEDLRASVDERNLNFVQFLYPHDVVRMEDLRGFGRAETRYDRPAFSLARNQDAICRVSNCLHCPYNGQLYDVYPIDTDEGRSFCVDFGNQCPRWMRIQEKIRPNKEPVRVASGIGFGE